MSCRDCKHFDDEGFCDSLLDNSPVDCQDCESKEN